MRIASWVIRNKTTKEVVMETFEQKVVDSLNAVKYEAIPIHQYLVELNAGKPLPAIGTKIKVQTDGVTIDGEVTGHDRKDGKPIIDYLGPCRLSNGQMSVPTTRWALLEQVIGYETNSV